MDLHEWTSFLATICGLPQLQGIVCLVVAIAHCYSYQCWQSTRILERSLQSTVADFSEAQGLDLKKVDVASKVAADDELLVIAYPHFNVNGESILKTKMRTYAFLVCKDFICFVKLCLLYTALCCISLGV